MRVCLMIEGQEGVSWEQWVALARAAEDAGLDGLFRSDHYRSIVRGEPAGSLDAWATLAGLAAVTNRIRLGTMVSPVTFRRVPVLAKMVTTVDHISAGRVELGLGAGWFEAEHDTYGFDFPPLRERMDELDRQLAEIVRHWDDAPEIQPKPLQRPHPPIIVGGSAKPRTVRAAVAHADEYNTVWPTVADARERRRTLDEAAASSGARATPLLDDDELCRRRRRGRSPRAPGRPSRRSPAVTGRRSRAPSTRSPPGCANTKTQASSARCSSTSRTRTSRWSRCWAASQPN